MGVYGNLLTAFPELMSTITVWTKPDKSDVRTIRGVYIPTSGDSLQSQKFSNRGQAIQYFEKDALYVSVSFKDKVDVGDYFYEPEQGHITRLTGRLPYIKAGGFSVYATERVTGATVDHTEKLVVNKPRFD